MKEIVDEADAYIGLESEPIEFKIMPLNLENNKELNVSELKKDTNINDIVIKYKDITITKDIMLLKKM